MEVSKSKKPVGKKSDKYKSIVSRISTVLMPAANKSRSSKAKQSFSAESHQSKDSNFVDKKTEEQRVVMAADSDNDPVYATAGDFDLEYVNGQNTSPPIPPKNLDVLYAKVQKKKDIGCNTDALRPIVLNGDVETSCMHIPVTSNNRGKSTKAVIEAELKDFHAGKTETNTEEILASSLLRKQQEARLSSRTKTQNPRPHHRKFKKTEILEKQPSDASKEISLSNRNQFSSCSSDCQSSPRTATKNFVETASFPKDKETEENLNKIIQKQQKEMRFLRQKMQRTSKNNEALHEQVEQLLEKESKWKQEVAQAVAWQEENLNNMEKIEELNQKIEKLQSNTEQEVLVLCDQIKLIKKEKDHLLSQLHSLHHENHSLYKKYEQVCQEKKSMTTMQVHVKAVEDHQRLLEEINQKHQKDLNKLQHMWNSAEEEKNGFSVQVQLLQEELKKLQLENLTLKTHQKEVSRNKDILLKQLEEVKQHEYQAMDLMASLLSVAEEVTMERDIILKKSEFQDHQQKQIHSTVVEYSLGVGRLQEHIVNIRKRMNEEIQKAAISTQCKDVAYGNLKQVFENQLDFLKEKVFQKNYAMDILEKEKRKLELDLENIWQAACHENQRKHLIKFTEK